MAVYVGFCKIQKSSQTVFISLVLKSWVGWHANKKNLVLGSWSNTNLQTYPMYNNFSVRTLMFKVNSSGKFLLVLFNVVFDFEGCTYRLCATVFFAVWLVINDMDQKITGLRKVNGFCCQAGEPRFCTFFA